MGLVPLVLSEEEISPVQCLHNITHIGTVLSESARANTAQTQQNTAENTAQIQRQTQHKHGKKHSTNTAWGKESLPVLGDPPGNLSTCFPSLFLCWGGGNDLEAAGQPQGSRALCPSPGTEQSPLSISGSRTEPSVHPRGAEQSPLFIPGEQSPLSIPWHTGCHWNVSPRLCWHSLSSGKDKGTELRRQEVPALLQTALFIPAPACLSVPMTNLHFPSELWLVFSFAF